MGEVANKPHVVCIPIPVQSHIKAMLKLAKLLHHKGFYVTFVNTDFNHKRFLKSQGPNSLDGLPDFQFRAIPDGLPVSDEDSTQDISLLGESIMKNFLSPFRDLIMHLNDTNPPVTCIAADGLMLFATKVAEELGIPIALLFPFAACAFMGYKQYPALVEKGLAPLKDESYLTNGFLDQQIDWIPGMEGICLKYLPTEFRTTNPNDLIFNGVIEVMENLHRAAAIVLHTFDALEQNVLDALSTTSMLPPVYAIGPLELLLNKIPQDPLKPIIGYSLWKEEPQCLEWLNKWEPNSVVYVNFGSIVVMTPIQFLEFGWGLANSKAPFLWVIRPDMVTGATALMPAEFIAETKERGLIANWCPQEQVLNHDSVGGFVTHSGWNSTIESLCAGVPMLCLPVFAEQQTNCYFSCKKWGIGMEMSNDVKRYEVERVVGELMKEEKGREMKKRVMEWKKVAEEASGENGLSFGILDKLAKKLVK